MLPTVAVEHPGPSFLIIKKVCGYKVCHLCASGGGTVEGGGGGGGVRHATVQCALLFHGGGADAKLDCERVILTAKDGEIRQPPEEGEAVAVRPGPFPEASSRTAGVARARIALCGIMRVQYEMRSLIHWVTYHLMLGIEHIYIYVDDTKPVPLTDSEKRVVRTVGLLRTQVTVAYVSALKMKMKGGSQVTTYNDCQRRAENANRYDWIASWDGDEYLTAGEPASVSSAARLANAAIRCRRLRCKPSGTLRVSP